MSFKKGDVVTLTDGLRDAQGVTHAAGLTVRIASDEAPDRDLMNLPSVQIETLDGVQIRSGAGPRNAWFPDRFRLLSRPVIVTPTEGPTTVNPTTSPTFKPGDRVKRISSSNPYRNPGVVPTGSEITVSEVVGDRIKADAHPGFSFYADTFELVDTRPEFEKLGIAPGDLVKATKGESVRQDRVVDGFSGALRLRSGTTLTGLEAGGYTFEIVEKALPPLPTEDGFYVEADPAEPTFSAFTADVYELDDSDWHVRPWKPGDETKRIPAPEHLRGKLVRLVAAEVAA